MRFKDLSAFLEKLEKTPSRNEMTQILADLFKESSPKEIDKVVYLSLGQLAPNYEGVVLNIAERMMVRILTMAYKVEPAKALALYKQKGDLGDVAYGLAQETKSTDKNLEVSQVYEVLMDITRDSGQGSQERKVVKMAELLSSLDPLSAKYVARIPVGRLRLGFSDMTILDALSVMLGGDKTKRTEIEAAFNVTVDPGKIAQQIRSGGLGAIAHVKPEPGTPIRPSLAERLPSAEKIIEKLGDKVAVEPKYDGFRAQVHVYKEKGEKVVRIYSRNLENTTPMFPDLVDSIKRINLESAIFDAEAIAYDSKNKKFLPFQETVQRKRKHNIAEIAKTVPLKLFVFDILYKNGESYLDKPFTQRRQELEQTLKGIDGAVEITRQDVISTPGEMREFIQKYLKEGLEGALIKKTNAVYKAGGRGYHWVKYKKNTEGGLVDTVDCVVMGTYKGRGKRSGFGLGAFLVGVRQGEAFQSITKIGTGLTDEQFHELNRRVNKLITDKKPEEYEVNKLLEPDIWVKPSLVVEILSDEITKSPAHTAGTKEGRGFALRFPRLVKFRDDKSPAEVTTVAEVKKLYDLSHTK